MSTPLANKTTISSRNRAAAVANGLHRQHGATTTTRIPQSRLNGPTAALTSRSSSILSTVSSTTLSSRATPRATPMGPPPPSTGDSRRQLAAPQTVMSKRPPLVASEKRNIPQTVGRPTNGASHLEKRHVPETVMVRKGLAKFSNPIECQRQFQALNTKLSQLTDVVDKRDLEIESLQDRLKSSINIGVGYAATVQYFSQKLKLNSKPNLLEECEYLKSQVLELRVKEENFETRIGSIVDDYKNHLQVEQDLKKCLEQELEATKLNHSNILKELHDKHLTELNDLNNAHNLVKEELEGRIENLETELTTKSKELVELKRDHELLNSSYSKLEETLTKDKDARVKYAQEKINQLQKDVESLNSVLEMRSERIHALEKDGILLAEVQNELMLEKDTNKALNQQIESIKAALEKRKEEYESLKVEKETIEQELKRERRERRRLTMKTEQLQFVLNESCAAESTMFDSNNIRDLDNGADHLV